MSNDSMPQSTMSAIEHWAGEWSDKFDQGWNSKSLKEWVGRKIIARTPPGVEPSRKVECFVVGYSEDVIFLHGNPVYRYSFITDQGNQISLFTKMEVEEVEE